MSGLFELRIWFKYGSGMKLLMVKLFLMFVLSVLCSMRAPFYLGQTWGFCSLYFFIASIPLAIAGCLLAYYSGRSAAFLLKEDARWKLHLFLMAVVALLVYDVSNCFLSCLCNDRLILSIFMMIGIAISGIIHLLECIFAGADAKEVFDNSGIFILSLYSVLNFFALISGYEKNRAKRLKKKRKPTIQ